MSGSTGGNGFTSDDAGNIMISGESATRMYQLLAIRQMLKLEVRTGMHHSKGSPLAWCQNAGITKKRTKRGAYKDLCAHIKSLGGPDDNNPLV